MLLSGCEFGTGNSYQDRMVSEDATQSLHELYNEQRFSEMYDLGAPEMHQSVSREIFIRGAAEGYARFGRLKKTTQSGTACFPFQVRLVYSSEYEKGPATEKMVWAVSQGKAKLVMFNISEGHATPTAEIKNQCPS